MAARDMSLRSLTAVLVLVGLTAVVVAAYWTAGLADAEGLYGLLQGLILGAFGWLYGSHGTERAEKAAAEAQAGRMRVEEGAGSAEVRIERLERELRLARAALEVTALLPTARKKINETLEGME